MGVRRWAFGVFFAPVAPGSHLLFIDWPDPARAVSFRLIVTNTANPPVELKNVIVSESEFTLSDVASGTAVKITITSRNSKGGESAASAPVTGTVP